MIYSPVARWPHFCSYHILTSSVVYNCADAWSNGIYLLTIFFWRQILHSEPPTLRNKLKEWASSKWNILDGFAVVSFFVGVGLRLHPVTRSAGHVVYCLDVMLWIIRLLDIFSVSKHMGPYVVMIGRMVMEYYIIL